MKTYFKQYRPFFIFLFKFFSVYIGLALLYFLYLKQFDATLFEVDGFTKVVAYNTKSLLDFLNYQVIILPHVGDPSYRLFIDRHPILRIVEGCNAVSVMILFVAFVIAFNGKRMQTLFFIFFGISLIHLLNVLRIALLSLGIVYYPKYEHLLHDVFFPLFLYGVVFGLWVIWVNKFSFYAKKST